MDVGAFRLGVTFAGQAGQHQRRGNTLALIAELGDNYGTYHEQLASHWRELGGRPEPADFQDDFAGYQAANQAMNDVLEAERALRLCKLLRSRSKDLHEIFAVPTVDGQEELFDFRRGRPKGIPEAPEPSIRTNARIEPLHKAPVPTPRGTPRNFEKP